MLYIRHSQKMYDNGEAVPYPLDPGLTENGRRLAYARFAELFDSYYPLHGMPKKIVSSPFCRTRETAYIAQEVIRCKTDVIVPVEFDPTVGEYLNKKNRDLALERSSYRSDTLKVMNRIFIDGNKKTLINRLKRSQVTQHENGVWYITHGIVIQKIAYIISVHNKSIDGEKFDWVKYPDILTGIKLVKPQTPGEKYEISSV